MEIFHNLILGFGVALSWHNLFYAFLGCFLGTMIGVLPGIGPMATIAILLPITFTLSPVSALIMLAGIYYGAQYGGSTTSILVNLPGEATTVITCIDGYQMARNGLAGPALSIAAIGSFFAGTVGTLIIALFGPPIAEMALKIASPEYCVIMTMALIIASLLAHGDMFKSLAMVVLGLLLGCMGTDIDSGWRRFNFGLTELSDGLSFVVIAIGVFGMAEIVANLGDPEPREVFTSKLGRLFPTMKDMKRSLAPIIRGTAVGAFFGTLPGCGAAIASFSAYMVEKKIARDPSRFGKGAIEGVAAPESANNAAAQCSFIPALTLGIPGTGSMALMLGALMIHGITPGPTVMTEQPDLFWGLIASMWIGNLMLIILNLPLVGIWVSLLKLPYRVLFPCIMVFSAIGVYSLNNSSFELYLAAIFCLVGFLWHKLECSPIPLMLGFILGPMIEENLRRAMLISRGDLSVFVTRPISLTFVIITVVIIVAMVTPALRKRRQDITDD